MEGWGGVATLLAWALTLPELPRPGLSSAPSPCWWRSCAVAFLTTAAWREMAACDLCWSLLAWGGGGCWRGLCMMASAGRDAAVCNLCWLLVCLVQHTQLWPAVVPQRHGPGSLQSGDLYKELTWDWVWGPFDVLRPSAMFCFAPPNASLCPPDTRLAWMLLKVNQCFRQ